MTTVATSLARGWLTLGVHLWQTTLLLLLVFLVATRLRSAPARMLHLLWCAAFMKILLPMTLFSSIAGSAASSLSGRLFETNAGSAAATLETVRAVLDPSSRMGLEAAGTGVWSFAALIALTCLWGLGVSRALAKLAGEYRAARAHRGQPMEALPNALRVALSRSVEGTSVPPSCILVTDETLPPYVAGLLRPRIFVSRHLLTALSSAEMGSILLHEDAHRRRRDPLRNAVQRFCSSLLFFYPLIGPLVRRLQEATELVCDERVVRAGVATETYARALARTMRFGLSLAPGSLAAGVGGGSLLRLRFERLTNPGRYSVMHSHRIILLLVVLIVAVSTFLPQPLVAERAEGDADIQKMPTIIDSTLVRPAYPEQEKRDAVEGTVVLRVKVTAGGEPDSIEIDTEIKGHPAFSEAAVEAVRQWRFEPAEADGEPVACEVKIPIQFALD